MHKIISWFIIHIIFIILVPLGAFFDTKQPPKPNMKQFFMKREKRTTNPSQCGKSCDLEFSSIYNSFLILSKIGGDAEIKFQDNIDLSLEIKRTRIFSLSFGNKNKDWINFYKNNGVKKNYDDFSYLDSDFGYEISEIIKVKITFTK
ncbi:hypothetical protein [Spiroplasma endosymbiont of Agriotes lineatus]|uniref:hypothetical protein n=1 Tax=Spiroplasma endosymbiont of Agriotes lineatus TaxID=3077930 RepID=UPI0030CD1D36